MLKRILYHMSIKRKLQVIFGIIIAATVFGGAVGVTGFSRVQVGGKAYSLIERNMLIADNIAKLRANLAFVRTTLLTMIIDDDSDKRQEQRQNMADLSGRINELFDAIDVQLREAGQSETLVHMATARQAWTAFLDTRDRELIPDILTGKIKEAMALARGIQSERYQVFSEETKKAVDRMRADVPDMVARIKFESKLVKVSFVAGSALFVAFLFIVSVFFSRTLIDPIVRVSNRSQEMAQGDFSHAAMNARGSDEIGVMIGNFSSMAGKVGETMSRLKMSILSLSSSSEELSATAEDLGRGASQQSHQAREVTAATSQMAQTITDMAQNTGQAAEAAKNSSKAAADGKKVVEMTAEGLVSITETVREAMLTIEGLSNSSGQIGEIVSLIHTIADQTNLLALNAAIEAARAGDQGRGFAVVADEVRKLADRTTGATRDIEQKISTIQAEAEKSLLTIKKGNAEVEKGMELARSASEALDSIVKASMQVMDMVQRIATATEEQSATSEEITRNMNSIAGVIDHSAEATQQIQQAAHGLAELASGIQETTAWFKIKTAQ